MIALTTQAVLATVDSAIEAIETLKADRADLVILVAYMAAEGYTSNDIAYAVEKPWKYEATLAAAKAAITKVTL